MNDEQRFFFDLKGWLLLPGILSEAECRAVREHIGAAVPAESGCNGPHCRELFTGPAQELLDHPAVVDVLGDILMGMKDDLAYPFRCEDSFVVRRSNAWQRPANTPPHVVLPASKGGPMTYQCRNRRIHSGLTRVVWELEPVRAGMGGTLFLSGTHKAEFPFPPSVLAQDNRFLETYSCPAGSALIFSESLLHQTAAWTDPQNERFAIFHCYNSLWVQWYRSNLAHELIAAMPAKRQSLFRGTYAIDFDDPSPTKGTNLRYSTQNRML
jgi:hypothetical protein